MNQLRVMSFNIRGSRFSDGENVWPNRAALNVATIEKYTPDLIGFQELDLGNLVYYREHLPGYEHRLGPEYGNREPYQYPAIFWRPDRLELRDGGGFWLSLTPDCHSASWETDCIRSANWARFSAQGAELLHLNTHLDHVSEEARAEGARLIAARLPELSDASAAAIVTGDFNCIPGSAAYAALIDAGLVDTYTAVHDEPTPVMSFHGFRGDDYELKSYDMAGRIDWILVRNLRVAGATIVRDSAPPHYPSDHYPVIADVL